MRQDSFWDEDLFKNELAGLESDAPSIPPSLKIEPDIKSILEEPIGKKKKRKIILGNIKWEINDSGKNTPDADASR